MQTFRWVNPQSIILTDYTVDRGALEGLGFYNVVQKTLNTAAADDRLNNRTIMEYLRRTVPKVFQNTLSVLSTTVIQQFLDELVWRENHGTSTSDAFHNMIRDLGVQVRAETGISLVKRLPLVNADPWKDWSVVVTKPPVHVPLELSALPVMPPNMSKPVAQKRPAVYDESGPAKEPRRSNYFATLTLTKKDAYVDSRDMDIICQVMIILSEKFNLCQFVLIYFYCVSFAQHTGCMKVMKSNLLMMSHLRQHLVRDLGMSDLAEWTQQCHYCLETFANADQRKKHEDSQHVFLQSFTVRFLFTLWFILLKASDLYNIFYRSKMEKKILLCSRIAFVSSVTKSYRIYERWKVTWTGCTCLAKCHTVAASATTRHQLIRFSLTTFMRLMQPVSIYSVPFASTRSLSTATIRSRVSKRVIFNI